jgi:predicted ATPase
MKARVSLLDKPTRDLETIRMTTLDYITVKGFKSIASIDKLALDPVNVLIGANGSGKSNFIEIFSFLHAIREGELQKYVRRAGGAEQLLHFGSKTTEEIEIKVSFGGGVNQYRVVLKPTDDDSLYPDEEYTYFWEKKKHEQPFSKALIPKDDGREAGISDPRATGVADWVRHRLGMWRIYHVHDTSSSSPMRKTAQLNDNEFLRPDGSNLASFLYLLSRNAPDHFRMIVNSIRRVAPFFNDFNLRPDPLNKETIRLDWKHRNSDQYFGPAALSDGTLRFIALATLFLQPNEYKPSVILVDEPELGLHPYAITLLASLISQASLKTQVILSTQSALLLDHFEPNQVLVADRVESGTRLERLDPRPLAEWLEEYSLGQLWEKNEIGGRPSSQSR